MTRARGAVVFLRVTVLVAALAGAGAALGHHGWTGYDEERTLKLTGTVREPRYEQPHGVIQLETPEKTWTVVLAPPTRRAHLLRWSRRALVLVVPSGALLFSAHAVEPPRNPAFRLKLVLLGAAWAGVIACGRMIAYL
ncbi:MAG TPA: DUF6152 family protein [Anaeromyxobacter sp.]|nr:DUF6152 family protein [Anaeromyxobacter sp.]